MKYEDFLKWKHYFFQSNCDKIKHLITHALGPGPWSLSLGPSARMRDQMLDFITI